MSERKGHFFKKFVRAISEFHILSIIAEKKEAHPYEIQQILQKKVLYKYQIQIQTSSYLVQTFENVLAISSNPKRDNKDIEKFIQSVRIPFLRDLCKKTIEKSKEEPGILANLEILKTKAEDPVRYKNTELKIWDSITAIYQVMNDLEKTNLIEVSRLDTYKGRTRKIYKITDKGREEGLLMLTIFGEVSQVTIPRAIVFQDNFDDLFLKHLNVFVKLIEFSQSIQLIQKKNLSEIMKEFKTNYPETYRSIENLHPLISNDSLLITLLMEGIFTIDNISNKKIDSKQKELSKYLILKKLIKFREKITKVIEYLE